MGRLSLDEINKTDQRIKHGDRPITKLRTHRKKLLPVSHRRPETEINDRPYFTIEGMYLASALYFSQCRG
jgi:hypothetical protein